MQTMTRSEKISKNRLDKRIERLYYARCRGIEINVMDIGKVFKAGAASVLAKPNISDDELGQAIYDFVQTIRLN